MFGDLAPLPSVKGEFINDVVIKRAENKITIERIKKNNEDPANNQLPIYRSFSSSEKQKQKQTSYTTNFSKSIVISCSIYIS